MSLPERFVNLLEIRSPIWQGTHRIIEKNLLTGAGTGSFPKAYPAFRLPEYFLFSHAAPVTLHSHNEFLEILAEGGIIGFLLVAGFLISIYSFILKRATPSGPHCILTHGLFSGSIGLLFQNIFSMSLRIPFISFYLWLGLGIGMGTLNGNSISLISLKFKRVIILLIFPLILWGSIRFILFPFLGDFYFEKGNLQKTNGNLTHAISHYSHALFFSPLRPDIYYKRAFILNKLGNEKEALEDYMKIEKISPGYAQNYLNMGITYITLGDFQNAVVNLKKAISMNPYDSHSHNCLGVAYAKNGYHHKAKEEFERALSLNPNLKEAHLNLMKLGDNYIP